MNVRKYIMKVLELNDVLGCVKFLVYKRLMSVSESQAEPGQFTQHKCNITIKQH